jgi:hypothetical protein
MVGSVWPVVRKTDGLLPRSGSNSEVSDPLGRERSECPSMGLVSLSNHATLSHLFLSRAGVMAGLLGKQYLASWPSHSATCTLARPTSGCPHLLYSLSLSRHPCPLSACHCHLHPCHVWPPEAAPPSQQ